MENINITIDELTLLFKNIIDNKSLNFDDNNILKNIIKEHDELKKQNFLLQNELNDKNLQISSLEECIIPNDDAINNLNKKYYNLKNKFDEIKKNVNGLLKHNDNLIIEHNKYIEELNNFKCKSKNDKNELKKYSMKLKENINKIKTEYTEINNKKILLESKIEEQYNLIDEIKTKNNNLYDNNSKQYDEIQLLKLNIDELNNKIININNENDNLIKQNDINNDNLIKQNDEIKLLKLNINELNNKIKHNDIKLGGNNSKQEIILNNDNIHLFDNHLTRKNIQHKNKLFFENELKQQEIKNNNKLNNDDNNSKISNNTNISFSTDYMVSYLKNDNKLKPKEEQINIINIINEDNENYNLNVDIFQKNNLSSLTILNISDNKINSSPEENYIDVSKINSEKNNIDVKINNDISNQNLNLIGGNDIKKHNNKPNNKMNIHIVDDIKKMYIGEELTTLTEQDINLNDKKKIHLTYNKKFKRFKREQVKNDKLIQELK